MEITGQYLMDEYTRPMEAYVRMEIAVMHLRVVGISILAQVQMIQTVLILH